MISIEIERYNVTVTEFLSYIKRRCAKKGADFIGIDRDYFENPTHNYYWNSFVRDGVKHCTNGHRRRNERTGGMDYVFQNTKCESSAYIEAETLCEFPYDIQSYIRYSDGSVYNEICEFTFDDEKRGHGYFYLLDKEVSA